MFPGNYKVLCEYLSKSAEILVKNTQHLDNVLETLDLQQHSLGYLVVLLAKFNSMAPDTADNRFAQVQEFIYGCNGEQIRLAPDSCITISIISLPILIFWFSVAELCHSLTNYLVEKKQPMKGILLLRKAISKLRFFDTQLTSIHADLCQLCLLAKCFKPSLEVLDTDITGICQEVPQILI